MTSRYLDDVCATQDEEYEDWVRNITEQTKLNKEMAEEHEERRQDNGTESRR